MIGYLAPEGYISDLLKELSGLTRIEETYDRLILTSSPIIHSSWAQNIWFNPRKVQVHSISQAAEVLRSIQRNWSLYSLKSHRRAHLISEKLPKISLKAREFPGSLPTAPMGSWTLLEDDLLLVSSECSSPFPNGEIYFKENKKMPPSRAYLKLWESLTLADQHPTPGQRCLDLGSSPGSWTWALHELGADVISVDKALLAPKIGELPRVQYLCQDAFTLEPGAIGPIDWFFSDVICYPHKLYELVEKWLKSGLCNKFICTLKFQGKELEPVDRQAVQAFTAIPHSSVRHLFHNKHELTWIKVKS
jgi:23S rRNA (cytidine2498-2'-O)-methyltransferase